MRFFGLVEIYMESVIENKIRSKVLSTVLGEYTGRFWTGELFLGGTGGHIDSFILFCLIQITFANVYLNRGSISQKVSTLAKVY